MYHKQPIIGCHYSDCEGYKPLRANIMATTSSFAQVFCWSVNSKRTIMSLFQFNTLNIVGFQSHGGWYSGSQHVTVTATIKELATENTHLL